MACLVLVIYFWRVSCLHNRRSKQIFSLCCLTSWCKKKNYHVRVESEGGKIPGQESHKAV